MADLDREIGRAIDALAECGDHNRVALLLDVAELFEESARLGGDFSTTDQTVATVYRMVADADLVATGQLTRRHTTGTVLESTLGPVADRMSHTPVLRDRAMLVADLADLIDDETAAESVAHMPYGGLVGGRDVMFMPSSFPKLVRNAFRRWRETRAV
jgi:hypothetical protein